MMVGQINIKEWGGGGGRRRHHFRNRGCVIYW